MARRQGSMISTFYRDNQVSRAQQSGLHLVILIGLLMIYPLDSSANIEERVNALLHIMTLEEKIGQMSQLSARDTEKTIQTMRAFPVGSILNAANPKTVNALQRIAVEETRLGIPLLVGRDVIHGYKTIFPIPLGLAATFNPDQAKHCARVSAKEASAAGIRWTFSPGMDITQDPRWGRMAESFGEDPYLVTMMSSMMIKGYQADQLDHPESIAACAKHFAGYGAVEGGRDYNSTFISERRLRNLYLRPFEAAVDAGCATFMTSFTDNDGVPASGDTFLLRELLRHEWGYEGMVVSDWKSISEMVKHGFCESKKEAALRAVQAGVNMEMVSETYRTYLAELIDEGVLCLETIDAAVRDILRTKFKLGLFEQPYVDVTRTNIFYDADHLVAAKQAAVESVVLLKNEEGTLPLTTSIGTLAVIGPLADAGHEQLGTWVFDGESRHVITPFDALEKEFGSEMRILYEPGLDYSRDVSTNGFSRAVMCAQQADVAVVFVGEESILSGEAHCLADLHLQGVQSELVQAIAETGTPCITVIMAGRPLIFSEPYAFSDAVLYAWHPGTMGGPAIAELLFGREVPSGKLPVTFPRVVGQIPIYYNHNNTGRPPTGNETLLDDIPIGARQSSLGNRSYYLDAGFTPFFPFGYGLSYTTFRYEELMLQADTLGLEDTLEVSFTLTNTGAVDATEVVQMYTRDIAASITRPVKELKRFKRIFLKAGESKRVHLSLPVAALAFWNMDRQHIVEPGRFNVGVGGNSQDLIETSFLVE